ncbi:hypothetical protein [Rhizobium rhizogenes]|uniref:hypothetical protein n=1 Tax=Rhizobium rhizogenes TaxID=359 RepID=UPI0022BA7A58|nr:hypothetical protein [Rhizobium rhizogenes]MCZ7482887.1 hypothetical protein [Rhizobium rhizogenes]
MNETTLSGCSTTLAQGSCHEQSFHRHHCLCDISGGVCSPTLAADFALTGPDISEGAAIKPARWSKAHSTVQALKTGKLEVPAGATAPLTGFFIYQNTIATATLGVTAGPRQQ